MSPKIKAGLKTAAIVLAVVGFIIAFAIMPIEVFMIVFTIGSFFLLGTVIYFLYTELLERENYKEMKKGHYEENKR